jgi:hypothetical protein
MLSRSIRPVSLVLVLALIAAGCHTVPLGDPDKSVSDAKLAGFWLSQKADKSGTLVHITLYDKHTYVTSVYGYSETGDAVKGEARFTTKAWETKVGEMDIMTFQIIDPEWEISAGKDAGARYSYYRIRRLDAGSIEMTALNIDLLKDTKTPEELAKKIADNANNPELFKGSESSIYKAAGERMDDVKKILKAFEPVKPA